MYIICLALVVEGYPSSRLQRQKPPDSQGTGHLITITTKPLEMNITCPIYNVYVWPQSGTVPVPALGRCKVLVPALGYHHDTIIQCQIQCQGQAPSSRMGHPVPALGPHFGTVPKQGQIHPVPALDIKIPSARTETVPKQGLTYISCHSVVSYTADDNHATNISL